MLHSIANAMTELQAMGIQHGDVQPCNVMIDDSGNVKLIDFMCYDDSKHNGLVRMIQSNFHSSPIAPELFTFFIKKMTGNNYNLEKADMWSLGITLLAICTICDYKTTLYDYSAYTIQTGRIAEEISQMSARYSQALVNCVTNLLQIDPVKRFSLSQLNKYINDHVEL